MTAVLERAATVAALDDRSLRERVRDDAWADHNLLGKAIYWTMWRFWRLGVRSEKLAALVLVTAFMALATGTTIAYWVVT